ncbi:MAG TPA: FimV/HubP family polar landmark protein [Usitatibacter sp.]
MRNLRSGAAIALLLGATVVAQAAGLGKLTVNSALGQILNAEIDLVSLQPGELDSLSARVAAPEAFRDARVEYSPSLRLLRFSVEKRTNGQPYLKVTSVAPVNEPFVDVLIEVTWPAGRIQREYPILLDPPGYAQGRVALPAATAATTPRAETPPAEEPAVAPSTSVPSGTAGTGAPSASAEMPPSGVATTSASSTSAGSDTYGPVQKGETLRKIAEQVKPSTVSMEQMLVALYRENKSAFAGNNMNRLKTGQILKVPSAEETSQIEAKEANREIRTQVADWKGYRDTLAGGVASLPSRADSSNAASGRVASAAVTPPPPPSGQGTDVLKLSRTDAGKGAPGKGGAGSQDRLNALQEEVTAKDKALKESQSRVADLEKQIRDMQRLLDLSKSGAAKPADTKVAAAPVPPPAKAESPKVAEVKPVDVPKPAAEPPPPVVAEAPKTEPPKVAEAPKTEEPKPAVDSTKAAPKKKAPPPPPPKEWYEDLASIDPIYMALGGAVVVGIPLAAFLFIRRRKRRAEAGPSSSMTSAFPSDLKPNTNTGKAGGGLVDTGNSSFLTDFDKTGPGTIDTDEVDPVAEAEVYIAYGRDAQAEEILKEAMARDKNRHEIALKLLEIYHARKSATAFETVAKELRAAVGDSHPLWQKAAAMGAQIDPSNPLYGSAAAGTATFTAMSPASAAAPAKPNLDFDLDGGANVSATEAHGSAPAPDFDLDLDGDKTSSEAAPDLPTESSSIDFDLAPSAPAPAPAAEAPAGEAKDEKPAFDFDLSGLDFPSSKPAEAPAPAPSSGGSMDLADLSLDAPAESGGEAVGTKLELAKAYLEIGDKDGAREILKEVAKEGSSAKREEASKLIASL